jgi:hypothetical protein
VGIHQDGHRPVIEQRDLHVGPKNTATDRFADFCFECIAELLVKRFGSFGCGGLEK